MVIYLKTKLNQATPTPHPAEGVTNMTIAIIGTGKMGSGLARLLASKGIDVAIGHKDPAKAAKLAEEIGSRAQGGGTEAAAKLADIVILAVPTRTSRTH